MGVHTSLLFCVGSTNGEMLVLLAILVAFAVAVQGDKTFVVPADYVEVESYMVFRQARSRDAAEAFCQSQGGHLAHYETTQMRHDMGTKLKALGIRGELNVGGFTAAAQHHSVNVHQVHDQRSGRCVIQSDWAGAHFTLFTKNCNDRPRPFICQYPDGGQGSGGHHVDINKGHVTSVRYVVVQHSKNTADAETYCYDQHGYLAHFDTDAQRQSLSTQMLSSGLHGEYWVGCHSKKSHNNWEVFSDIDCQNTTPWGVIFSDWPGNRGKFDFASKNYNERGRHFICSFPQYAS